MNASEQLVDLPESYLESSSLFSQRVNEIKVSAYPHFLHVMAILFVLNVLIMLLIGKMNPRSVAFELQFTKQVDITPWRHARWVSVVIIIVVCASYVVFS